MKWALDRELLLGPIIPHKAYFDTPGPASAWSNDTHLRKWAVTRSAANRNLGEIGKEFFYARFTNIGISVDVIFCDTEDTFNRKISCYALEENLEHFPVYYKALIPVGSAPLREENGQLLMF